MAPPFVVAPAPYGQLEASCMPMRCSEPLLHVVRVRPSALMCPWRSCVVYVGVIGGACHVVTTRTNAQVCPTRASQPYLNATLSPIAATMADESKSAAKPVAAEARAVFDEDEVTALAGAVAQTAPRVVLDRSTTPLVLARAEQTQTMHVLGCTPHASYRGH